MVYSCGQLPFVMTSLCEIATAASQLSVPLAESVFAGEVSSVQLITVSGGQTIRGLVVSCTVINWTQVLVLLQSSVASQVRVMVYSCGQLPFEITSLCEIATDASQLSVPLADNVFAGVVSSVQLITVSGGQTITGLVVS